MKRAKKNKRSHTKGKIPKYIAKESPVKEYAWGADPDKTLEFLASWKTDNYWQSFFGLWGRLLLCVSVVMGVILGLVQVTMPASLQLAPDEYVGVFILIMFVTTFTGSWAALIAEENK